MRSIREEINPEYTLKGLMLELQYLGHLIQKSLIARDPDAGKDCRQNKKRVAEGEITR